METRVPKPPLHPFSALAVIAIDGVSTVAELGATATVLGLLLVPVMIVLSGLMSFLVVTLIEWQVAHRSRRGAVLAGGAMGLLTALPYLFAGGLAGGVALAWAGIFELQKPLPPA
jgi:hypothetical protein